MSSTTSTLASGASKNCCFMERFCSRLLLIVSKSPAGSSQTIFCGIVTVKSEPFPYSLSTFISPSISLSSDMVIFIPRPVPSIFLFFSSSSLWKLSNSFPISSFLIPIPVSFTDMISPISPSACLSYVTFISIEPCGVYLTALVSRLVTICFILTSSPKRTRGSVSSRKK